MFIIRFEKYNESVFSENESKIKEWVRGVC